MKVLLVEDDEAVSDRLVRGFSEAGYSANTVANGFEALELASAGGYDILIVDVLIPGLDGFSLLQELRQKNCQTPLIFIREKATTEARIEGLRRGGDDYIAKPFSVSEVIVRAEAILRRTSRKLDTGKIVYLDLELDPSTRIVRRGNQEIELHQKEFALLEYLLRNKDKVLTKNQIIENVWGIEFGPQTNVVDVLVCRVRNKIDKGQKVKLIKTFRGVGYAIRSD